MIQMRCKTDLISTVEKINLWGNELDDVALLKEMPNLKIIALSLNNIVSLKVFAHCPKLKELYLRKNLISDLSELTYL